MTHKGIEYDKLFYNSADLTRLRARHGESIDIEYSVDDGDIGKISVFSPDNKEMYLVPALNQKYAAGTSRFQHKVIKRYAAEKLERYDSTGWLEAKEQIAEMIRDEFALKKARSRSRIARYRTGGVSKPDIAGVASLAVNTDTDSGIPGHEVSIPQRSKQSEKMGVGQPVTGRFKTNASPKKFQPLTRERNVAPRADA